MIRRRTQTQRSQDNKAASSESPTWSVSPVSVLTNTSWPAVESQRMNKKSNWLATVAMLRGLGLRAGTANTPRQSSTELE